MDINATFSPVRLLKGSGISEYAVVAWHARVDIRSTIGAVGQGGRTRPFLVLVVLCSETVQQNKE